MSSGKAELEQIESLQADKRGLLVACEKALAFVEKRYGDNTFTHKVLGSVLRNAMAGVADRIWENLEDWKNEQCDDCPLILAGDVSECADCPIAKA